MSSGDMETQRFVPPASGFWFLFLTPCRYHHSLSSHGASGSHRAIGYSSIPDYLIPDSDLDDSGDETCQDPRKEENHEDEASGGECHERNKSRYVLNTLSKRIDVNKSHVTTFSVDAAVANPDTNPETDPQEYQSLRVDSAPQELSAIRAPLDSESQVAPGLSGTVVELKSSTQPRVPGSNYRATLKALARSEVIMSSASAPVYVRRAPHCTKCHLPRKDHDLQECLEIQLAQYQSLAEAAQLSLSTASNLNDLRTRQTASTPLLAPQASSSKPRRRLSGQVRRRRPVAFESPTRKGRAGRLRKAPLSVSEVEDTGEESTDGSSDDDELDTVQEKKVLQPATKPPAHSLVNRRGSCLKRLFYEIMMFTLTIISATTLAFLTNQVLVILTARAGIATFAVDTVVCTVVTQTVTSGY
ncbi:hypothetical protein BKA70DRAFT_1439112 [Coprinopsis sp. MPI-PUGE-AT-0042]|nr:hypothetical protein BKA70DRAFT_1439112 [Coprinopsis sp. MPI-PUGE-AT-0042]